VERVVTARNGRNALPNQWSVRPRPTPLHPVSHVTTPLGGSFFIEEKGRFEKERGRKRGAMSGGSSLRYVRYVRYCTPLQVRMCLRDSGRKLHPIAQLSDLHFAWFTDYKWVLGHGFDAERFAPFLPNGISLFIRPTGTRTGARRAKVPANSGLFRWSARTRPCLDPRNRTYPRSTLSNRATPRP